MPKGKRRQIMTSKRMDDLQSDPGRALAFSHKNLSTVQLKCVFG
ncbi:hypothetical protein SynMVIR181_02981 [Synechococcus sp. MVIR-18-1]|nr:hypothetical protein SynMVIR181_02981 [Synechococcus sp. MVIR-18-1]